MLTIALWKNSHRSEDKRQKTTYRVEKINFCRNKVSLIGQNDWLLNLNKIIYGTSRAAIATLEWQSWLEGIVGWRGKESEKEIDFINFEVIKISDWNWRLWFGCWRDRTDCYLLMIRKLICEQSMITQDSLCSITQVFEHSSFRSYHKFSCNLSSWHQVNESNSFKIQFQNSNNLLYQPTFLNLSPAFATSLRRLPNLKSVW
jgi:hypothetical protein